MFGLRSGVSSTALVMNYCKSYITILFENNDDTPKPSTCSRYIWHRHLFFLPRQDGRSSENYDGSNVRNIYQNRQGHIKIISWTLFHPIKTSKLSENLTVSRLSAFNSYGLYLEKTIYPSIQQLVVSLYTKYVPST